MAILKKKKSNIKTKKTSTKKVGIKKVAPKRIKTSNKTKTKKTAVKKNISKKSKLKSKPKLKTKNTEIKSTSIKLIRTPHNPIISPSYYSWESRATFNPAAVESNGKIHLLYRAIGEDDRSVLGYASTFDGFRIAERPTYAVYQRYQEKINYDEKNIGYISGGGWSGGCEDPRLSLIDDTLYMLYVAFDGWGSVRIALTSILFNDFKKKRWNWKKPVFISPPGQINKNWALFPEKINGKFAIIHSFYPEILVDYFDDINELNGKKFIKSNNTRPTDNNRTWDSWFRGIGPTPIKTKDGWLILYHAMDHRNPDRYRMGALLLDLKDPTKILHRSVSPILEPEEHYENNGHKWGVIYSCGAVVRGKELFVYYGGADKFVCVASIPLEELLSDLKSSKPVKLKNKKIIK